jgi:hypothetical protein
VIFLQNEQQEIEIFRKTQILLQERFQSPITNYLYVQAASLEEDAASA